MLKRIGSAALLVSLVFSLIRIASADDTSGKQGRRLRAKLTGFQEVPANSTAASGEFTGTINEAGDTIEFTLKYSNMSSAAAVSHIHLGQARVNGGVMVFLCGGGGRPACPAGNTDTVVTVTGTIVAADVIGPTGQGIAAGEFAEVLKAIRSGVTYVNVHTAAPPNGLFPGGEIRGAIEVGRGHAHDDADHDDDQ